MTIALRDRSLRYLKQRLGYFRTTVKQPLWIHCASVGEANTALIFVRAWLKRHPDDSLVLTTNTVTAARILAARASKDKPGQIGHYYLPLDYPLFCRRFLDVVDPRCALIMETEIWLNLFHQCKNKNIPLLIINARLSQRTIDGARRFKHYYRQSLAAVEKILARGEKDASAFAALGADPGKIDIVGNLKNAGNVPEPLPDLIGRPYILAASTHKNEEVQAARAWQQAYQHAPGLSGDTAEPLLVIAPRHPRRGAAIARQLEKLGFGTRLRSRSPTPKDNPKHSPSIYIADTLGELPALICHADLVFMGGSLVPVGGHNVLEPARLGTPQVVGPHTHNFHDEVTALKAVGGIIEAADGDALAEVFRAALDNAPEHTTVAQRARKLVQQYENIADAYVRRVETTIAPLDSKHAQPDR